MRTFTVPAVIARSRVAGVGLVALLFALVLPACGGGSSTPTPGPAATTAATTASAVATTSAVATPGGASGSTLGAAATFCGDWGRMLTEASAVTGGLTSTDSSATSMKDDLAQTSTFLKALSDHAPAEIKPDFEVYAKFWNDFSAAMAKADYDVTKVMSDPTLMAAFQSMTDARLQQATDNIDAWITKNCGQ